MQKKTLYPKTTRIGAEQVKVILTEKLDGSNLGFYTINGELFVGQRNNIFGLSELEQPQVKEILYGGLYGWLKEHGEELAKSIYPGSVVFGEWLGMGKLKYDYDSFGGRFVMFAKGRIDEADLSVSKMFYSHDYFKYVFGGEMPSYIGLVPIVVQLDHVPTLEELDVLYEQYSKYVGRPVEGFVMNINETIKKYVRMKNGKLAPHTVAGE